MHAKGLCQAMDLSHSKPKQKGGKKTGQPMASRPASPPARRSGRVPALPYLPPGAAQASRALIGISTHSDLHQHLRATHKPMCEKFVALPAASLAPESSADHFIISPIEKMPFPDERFDFVICNAVLHFAPDEDRFLAMVRELARVLRRGGTFFARLMSTTGVESLLHPLGGRRYLLPGGQLVFLVDEALLLNLTTNVFHGQLIDPLKSTVVHNQRTMTTWILRRN
jgi:SAM-dependent methyltransferase